MLAWEVACTDAGQRISVTGLLKGGMVVRGGVLLAVHSRGGVLPAVHSRGGVVPAVHFRDHQHVEAANPWKGAVMSGRRMSTGPLWWTWFFFV